MVNQILIDSRTGSTELHKLFPSGRSTIVSNLPTDFEFTGQLDEKLITIGVERKTIPDAICSLMSERFQSDQLPLLVKNYQVQYLFIEGTYRKGHNGLVQIREKRKGWYVDNYSNMLWEGFTNQLNSIELYAGIHVLKTNNECDTVNTILSLFNYYQKSTHTGYMGVNSHKPPFAASPSLGLKIAVALPGIKWTLGRAIMKEFKTTRQLLQALLTPGNRWQGIPKMGKKRIECIINAVNE